MLDSLLCLPFKTFRHKNAYDVLSGSVVTFDHDLLFEIVSILSSMREEKIDERSFFSKYLKKQGVLWSNYRDALKELMSYRHQGIFLKDTHTYEKEARHLDQLLKGIKKKFSRKQQAAALVLNITHACNLRCHYCHNTGNVYDGCRVHSVKSMSFDLARKLIADRLFYSKNSKDSVDIIFFGGEPLLEFQKLRALIMYARQEKRRLNHKTKSFQFSMATNGILLTEDIIKFCIKNRIHLQVSIDGPQAIHDKNRMTADGRGSFRQVVRNLKELKRLSAASTYPQYFDKYIKVNATNFYQTDQETQSVVDFFSRSSLFNGLLNRGRIMFEAADVMTLKGEYKKKQIKIDAQSKQAGLETLEDWKSEFKKKECRIKRLLDILSSTKESSSKKEEATRRLARIIEDYEAFLVIVPGKQCHIRARTGACIPGDYKQFVDLDGKIYICTECRLNKTTMIGQGGVLDFKKVVKTMKAHVLQFGHECRVCPVFVFCKQCVIQSADNNGLLKFKRKSVNCRKYKEDITKKFSFIYSMIEAYPEFERFIRKEYRKSK